MDDGTVARLGDELFYVTTTSTGSEGVCEWFEWWNAVWGYDVEIVNVTGALAAVNLAGPQARDALAPLTDADVSNEAFKYLDAKELPVAGVPCLALRIGFVGELGYELHCAASVGEHLWDALVARRRRAVRPRAAAGPPPREGAHHRRPGHRLRVEPARGRDALDRQARQGRLRRQVGARARAGARRARAARRLHAAGRRRCRPRARRSSSTAARPAASRARAGASALGQRDRPRLGASPSGRGGSGRSRSGSTARLHAATVTLAPFYDPEGSGSAREPARLPLADERDVRGLAAAHVAARVRRRLALGKLEVRGESATSRGRELADRPGRALLV